MTYPPCEMLSQKRVGRAWTSAPQDRQVTHVRRFRRLSLRRFATRPSKSNTDGDGLECLKARSGYGRGQRHSEGDTGARCGTGQGVGRAALRRARPRRSGSQCQRGRDAGPERAGARSVPGLAGRAQGFALRLSEAGSRGRVLRHGSVTASCVPAALRGDHAAAAAGAGSRGLTAAGPWWRPLRKWLDFGKCVIAIWNAAKSPAARCLRVTAGGGGGGGLLPSPDWPQGRSVVSVWPGRRTQAFWQTLF